MSDLQVRFQEKRKKEMEEKCLCSHGGQAHWNAGEAMCVGAHDYSYHFRRNPTGQVIIKQKK